MKVRKIAITRHGSINYHGDISDSDDDATLIESELAQSAQECIDRIQLKINILKETHHVE